MLASKEMYDKLDELLRMLGVEPPQRGTMPEDCIPIIQQAIEKVKDLQCLAVGGMSQYLTDGWQ